MSDVRAMNVLYRILAKYCRAFRSPKPDQAVKNNSNRRISQTGAVWIKNTRISGLNYIFSFQMTNFLQGKRHPLF